MYSSTNWKSDVVLSIEYQTNKIIKLSEDKGKTYLSFPKNLIIDIYKVSIYIITSDKNSIEKSSLTYKCWL